MVLSLTTLQSIAPDLLNKQLLAYFLGFVLLFSVSRLPLVFWQRIAPYLYWGLNFILLALLLVGQVTRGIVAWIQLPFGFRFQPSQLAVMGSALFLARQLKIKSEINPRQELTWSQIFYLLIHLLIPALLIVLEPDLAQRQSILLL